MKQTININLGGIVFHIDDDAYESLNNYLEKLKKHFKKEESYEEIIQDIENRIAELFQEKLNENKEVITQHDLNDVIKILGEPEDFADEEASTETNTSKEQAKSEKNAKTANKRLFRDPDNKLLAGICGGLGAYLKLDPLWIRLFFLLLLFTGPIVLGIYIVLWILVPKASTTSEKLEMKGEPVNINNIEKSIKEDLNDVKKKFKQYRNNELNDNPLDKFISLLTSIIRFSIKTFIIIFGLILLLGSLGSIIATVLGFVFSFTINPFNDFHISEIINVFVANNDYFLAKIGLFIAIFIPMIYVFYLGIRLVFNVKKGSKFFSLSELTVWIVGVVILITIGLKIGNDFKERAVDTYMQNIACDSTKTIKIDLSNAHNLKKHSYFRHFRSRNLILNKSTNGMEKLLKPQLYIEKTFDTIPSVKIKKISYGADNEDALRRAKTTTYSFKKIKNNNFVFDKYFIIPDYELYRNQEVEIILYIPDNYTVEIDYKTKPIFIYQDNEVNVEWKSL